jgi:hypothetical protein
MKTDWNLIRDTFNAAIDALETVDRLAIDENHRHLPFEKDGEVVCHIWDFLQSSWTYPENLSFDLVRARHDLNADHPYTNEKSRTLLKVAQLCAELVDTKDVQSQISGSGEKQASIEQMVKTLSDWYRNYMIPALEKTMKDSRTNAV